MSYAKVPYRYPRSPAGRSRFSLNRRCTATCLGFYQMSFSTLGLWTCESSGVLLVAVVCKAAYVSAILTFWRVLLDSVVAKERAGPHWLVKWFLTAYLWVATTMYFVALHRESYADPFFVFSDELEKLWHLHLSLILCAICHVSWYLWMWCRDIAALRAATVPNRLLYAYTVAVMIVSLLVFGFGRFGPIPTSPSNFVAMQLLSCLYLYTLSLLFVPVKAARSALLRPSPTIIEGGALPVSRPSPRYSSPVRSPDPA
eukprot:GHVU01157880.1.p1 GENE.GHVU01157880.1~~GHVU01157880.1.p1  ORF type:complete len:257 (-),score=32.44 GHVU01157880.1:257-1027(-)